MIQKRTVIIVGVVVVLVAAIGAVSAVFSYGITRKQWEGGATRAFAKMTAFPAAKVGGQKATYSDYLSQIDAQRVYLKTEDARQRQLPTEVNQQTRDAAYEQVVQIAALDQLAKEYGVSVSDADVDKAFDDFVAQSGTSTQPGEIDAFLNTSFGWTRAEFKKFFIHPGVVSQALREKMTGTTEDEKGAALGQKLSERMTKEDVKKYLVISP